MAKDAQESASGGSASKVDHSLMEQILSPDRLLTFMQLPYKRQAFIFEYFLDPTSKVQAAVRAGYSNANVSANSALNDREVAAILAELMNARVDRTMITADRILQELAILAFSDVSNYRMDPITGKVTLDKGVPDYVMRAVQSVKHTVKEDERGNRTYMLELKLWSKPAAIQLAMRHMGMLHDELNVNMRGSVEHKQVWDVGGRTIEF